MNVEEKRELFKFLKEWTDYGGIYRKADIKTCLEKCGIEVNIEKDTFSHEHEEVHVRTFGGFFGCYEAGYCVGFVIQSLDELFNGNAVPQMIAVFESSPWYLFEVIENSEKACKNLLEFIGWKGIDRAHQIEL